MRENDKLYLRILKVDKAEVAVLKGKVYKWLNHLDGNVRGGEVMYAIPPFKFFIVGVATEIFRG